MRVGQHTNWTQAHDGPPINIDESRLSFTQVEMPWAAIQPTSSDHFDFGPLNDLLTRWAVNGKTVMPMIKFCPSGDETYEGSPGPYAASSCPAWLFKSVMIGGPGCPSVTVTHKGQAQRVPVQWSSQFQFYLDKFISGLAGMYDGDPRIEAFGCSVGHFCQDTATYPDQKLTYIPASGYTASLWIQANLYAAGIYARYFKKTPVYFCGGDRFIGGETEPIGFAHVDLAESACKTYGVGYSYHDLRGTDRYAKGDIAKMVGTLATRSTPIMLGLDNPMLNDEATYGDPRTTVAYSRGGVVGIPISNCSRMVWYAKDVREAGVRGTPFDLALTDAVSK